MRNLNSLFILLVLLTGRANAQTKYISNQELAAGCGVFFEASMDNGTSLITMTMSGPSDRWFGAGFGLAMNNADVLLYTSGETATPHALDVWDYRLSSNNSNGSGVNLDNLQNWTILSNTVVGSTRTITATRPLNSPDNADIDIAFANTTLNVIWAKGATASNTLAYHGAANRGSTTLTWIVPDVTPPALAVNPFSPANNATIVPLNTGMTASFTENIVAGTGNIELRLLSNNALVEAFDVSTAAITISSNQISFQPSSALLGLTDYYIVIPSTAIKDAAGNSFAGFADNTTWNFQTIDPNGDYTPPFLANGPFSPADNAVSVSYLTNLTATFSEDIQAGSGVIELRKMTGNLLVESFSGNPNNVSFVGNQVIINPTQPLQGSTEYYVTIGNNAITDLAGNSFVGFTDNVTWNFTIGIVDSIAPVLTNLPFIPADNATNVPLTTDLTATFSEPVVAGNGVIVLWNTSTLSILESFDVSTNAVVFSGNQITINPTNDLTYNSSYFVTIPAGAIRDTANNSFAGFTNSQTWSFSTANTSGLMQLGQSQFVCFVNENNELCVMTNDFIPYNLSVYNIQGQCLFVNRAQVGKQVVALECASNQLLFIHISDETGNETSTKVLVK